MTIRDTRILAPLFFLLGLGGCTQAIIESQIKPEILQVARYEYPYEGLKLAIDPQGYSEFVYMITPDKGDDPELVTKNTEWAPVSPELNLPFTPYGHREWHVTLSFKHDDGAIWSVAEKFSVGLPPWHVKGTPVEFDVNAQFTCLWSEDLKHMGRVKTLITYAMEADLPAGLDKSRYVGFSAIAPAIKPGYQGKEREPVPGEGGGRVTNFEEKLSFAGNYQLGSTPYPRCEDLDTLEVSDWGTSQIRLLDKYHFPVNYAVGRVKRSEWTRRNPTDQLGVDHLGRKRQPGDKQAAVP